MEQKKCPFCAEMIQADAIKCRFCQTMLVDEKGHPLTVPGSVVPATSVQPSVFWIFFWNLLAPGMGAIKLGHKARGWLILGIMIVAMCFWTKEAMVVVNESLLPILKGGHGGHKVEETLKKVMEQTQSGFWYEAMFWIYLGSFIDLAIIFPWKKKPSEQDQPGKSN